MGHEMPQGREIVEPHRFGDPRFSRVELTDTACLRAKRKEKPPKAFQLCVH